MYLLGVKALHAWEVVGPAMECRMPTDLVSQAWRMAVRAKRPRPGLIHHSDRGAQYCAQSNDVNPPPTKANQKGLFTNRVTI